MFIVLLPEQLQFYTGPWMRSLKSSLSYQSFSLLILCQLFRSIWLDYLVTGCPHI
jgi:hypothetical protein